MEYNTQTCVLERACRIKKLLFEYDYPLYIFFYNIRIPNNTQESKFSNQTMGGGKKQRAGKIHVYSNLCGDTECTLAAHPALLLLLVPFKNKNTCLMSTMEDTKLANKASERLKTIRKNKDFYDLHSSHFTSSKDGNVDRAMENRHAREKATATATATAMEQKVDLQCTCKSLLLRSD